MSRKMVSLGINSHQVKEKKAFLTAERQEKEQSERRASRRALVLLGAIVMLICSIGVLAGWRSLSSAGSPNALEAGLNSPVVLPTSTPPLMPANAPSKEFVYAGSALLATTEAFREPPDDIAVWRPGTRNGASVWYVLNAQQQTTSYSFGVTSDTPITRDFDGDGKTDFCVYRSGATSEWHIVKSSDSSYYAVNLGTTNDIPAAADFDGDGKADVAVWRPSNGTWYINQSSNNTLVSQFYGASTDKPEPADFDGDGKADYAVWRDSVATFYIKRSSDGGYGGYSIGASGDKPVIGDYDGDGKADYATWRSSDGYWRILKSATNTLDSSIQWGNGSDIPVQGNYSDSDAKTDVAIWRPTNGTWYIKPSDNSVRQPVAYGQAGDTPIPAPFKR